MQDGKVVYRMMGEGDLPMDAIMRALRSINYEGYVSLEWVRRYAPDLSDAGIVFPHFANFMSAFLGESQEAHHLCDNNAGTGKYVWPKEHLIDLTFPQVLGFAINLALALLMRKGEKLVRAVVQRLVHSLHPVSYTHLDVYKRQVLRKPHPPHHPDDRAARHHKLCKPAR